jgi:hypothetical protein
LVDILFFAKNPKQRRRHRTSGRLLGRRGIVSRFGRVMLWVLGAVTGLTAAPAHAQSNLDAGKSAAQIFGETCNACHRSPRELKPTSPGFMREHYTTGPREAAAMATYLSSIGSDPGAVRQRKPPALGAGGSGPTETATARPPQNVPTGAAPDQTENGKPSENQAALPSASPGRREKPIAGEKPAPASAVAVTKPRRPSDSMEVGKLTAASPAGGGAEVPAQSVAAPAARPSPAEEFEE